MNPRIKYFMTDAQGLNKFNGLSFDLQNAVIEFNASEATFEDLLKISAKYGIEHSELAGAYYFIILEAQRRETV